MGTWKPIETAPLIRDERILICNVTASTYRESGPTIGWFTGTYYEDGDPIFENHDTLIEATHWMPLPDPPSRQT